MKSPNRICRILLPVLTFALLNNVAAAEPQTLHLLGRPTLEKHLIKLKESDKLWLQHKHTLVLGTSTPDNAPFEIISNDNEFEGITADFVTYLSDALGVTVIVKRYDSRDEVIAALKAGELDMVGFANNLEAQAPELALTVPYMRDQPVIVTRTDDTAQATSELAHTRIAMFDGYLSQHLVHALYPEATVLLYPSNLNAIGAVAFGQADAYLGDYISANYLINKNYLNHVHLADFSSMAEGDFSFALARNDTPLLSIINTALEALPLSERMVALKRWSSGNETIQSHRKLQFSDAEQTWIDQHPRLSVAVNDDLAPLSFFDSTGNFRGITADILARISLRTGLSFDVQYGNSERLLDEVKDGKIDLLAAFISNLDRAKELAFTRAYLTTPFVLVAGTHVQSNFSLNDLSGKTVSVIKSSSMRRFLADHYPNLKVTVEDTSVEAMSAAAKGDTDAAIVPLINANYSLEQRFPNQLKIVSTVGTAPARIAFGASLDSPQLRSIMNKALMSISPDEMDELSNRWRLEVMPGNSFWAQHGQLIIKGLMIFAGAVLLLFAWVFYLRKLVSQRNYAQTALYDQIEFKHALVYGTPHPIYVRDHRGRMVLCNDAYLQVVGLKLADVIGKTITELPGLSYDDAQNFHQEYMKVLRDGEPVMKVRTVSPHSSADITVYHWLIPYRGSDGRIAGIISGWIDISEREVLLKDAQQARYDAEEANRSKTTFFASMSHEIRTPMNAVIGMLELAIRKSDHGILDRVAIDVAYDAAQNLLELISDILDVARIESRQLVLAPERINLRTQLDCLLSLFQGLAQQKNLALLPKIDANADVDVLLDTLRFKQIMTNILGNSIKFTARGEVTLTVEAEPNDDHTQLQVRIVITDTGIGISEQDRQRLFQPFVQGSNNTHTARAGSGLGLVISRELCEMMSGELNLSSTLGEGTQVEISLELPILEPLTDTEIRSVDLAPQPKVLNILIVDDYPANRQLLTQQLRYLGHYTEEAPDGSKGLRTWRNGNFDVIITDCNMPITDGYDMTRAIRSEEFERGDKPCLIIGFTATVHEGEKQRCLNAGMDDCMAKPIGLQELSNRLAIFGGGEVVAIGEPQALSVGDRIDLRRLKQLTQGNNASLKVLLKDLLSSTEDDLAQLQQQLAAPNLLALQQLAHRVKGGARIVKAQRLINSCETLEQACDESGDAQAQGVESCIENLLQEMIALSILLSEEIEHKLA